MVWRTSPTFDYLYALALVTVLLMSIPPAYAQVGGNNFVTNVTAVPVPGVGHDYLHDLNEVVNPANGSLSVRIEAPRPKERGLNYPLYAFMYDSTQQFTFQYQTTAGGAYIECGIDSAGDNLTDEPTQPLTCISAVSFPYQSIAYPGGTQGTLSGPNSMLAANATYSRWYNSSTYKTCNLYGGYSYEDPYGVIHDLGAYGIVSGQNSNTNNCQYLGITPSPIGGDEQYKIALDDTALQISFPNNGTLTAGYGILTDTHGTSVHVTGGGPATTITALEDTNGNGINSSSRFGSYQSFQPWGDAFARTGLRTFAGGSAYTYTWGTATTSFNPSSVDVSVQVIEGGVDYLCHPPALGLATTNPVVTQMTEPDDLYYTFGYDPVYGLLNKITYPTGAWVEYTWGTNHLSDATGFITPAPFVNYFNDPVHTPVGNPMYNTSCMFEHDTPAIAKRVVSYDGTTPALEQDFSYTTNWVSGSSGLWSSKTTIVTTKDLISPGTPSFTTVYTYAPWPAYTAIGNHQVSSALTLENTIVYKNVAGNVLKTVTKAWNSYLQLAGECTTLPNGKTDGVFYEYQPYSIPGGLAVAGTPSAFTTNAKTDVAEYDYGLITAPCQKPTSTPTRETVTTYAVFPSTPLYPTFTYWNGTSAVPVTMPPMPDRPATTIKYQSGAKIAETDYTYDETTPTSVSPVPYGHDETNYKNGSTVARGNLTTIRVKCFQGSVNCTDSAVSVAYDTTGQPVSVTDPKGNVTQLSYQDNYTSDDGTPTGNTNTYLTKITRPQTNGVAHIESFQWDFNKGALRTLTDENQNQTFYQYVDPWWRLTQITFPDGGTVTNSYQDAGPNPSVTSSTAISSSATMTVESIMDGFGHVIQTQSSDPEGVDYVNIAYDGLGRTKSVTNPFRSTSDLTYGITNYSYDSLGRQTLQVQPDGGLLQWCYDDIASSGQNNCLGNASSQTNDAWIDFSDEIGNHWQRTYDAFGRLTSVIEPNGVAQSPSMETDYSYDGLNDLLAITQNGTNSSNARVRSFTYDSLGRITQAVNPESGTISYTYDANSNVITKISPEPNTLHSAMTTTTYSYDALNRLLSYTNINPNNANSFYGYDGVAIPSCPGSAPPTISSPYNLIGRRSSMCTAKSASSWSYDPMGRPILDVRTNTGPPVATLNIGYTYYQNGSLKTLTYPSGDVLTYTVLSAGRATQVSDNSNTYVATPSNWPTTPMYTASGLAASMKYGTAITTNNRYNNRLQPILLSAATSMTSIFSLCFDFHLHSTINSPPCEFSGTTTGDNGNIFQVINNNDSTRSAAFAYDSLNRLSQANTINTTSSNCWGEIYTIDAWGNLTNRAGVTGMSGCTYEPLSLSINTNNQFIGLCTGTCYDVAGNIVNDGVGNQPTYDAESRISTDAGVTYSYDGDGVRINKSSGTMYWPSPIGETLSETTLAGVINEEYVYLNGDRVARIDRPSGAVHYYFSNNVGSAIAVTDANGNAQEQTDYFPFGGVAYNSGSDSNRYRFTAKERDSESSFDQFGARYYSFRIGRFMTPDWSSKPTAVPYASFGNPQSLNLYSFVKNNPTTVRDPDGHCPDGLDVCFMPKLASDPNYMAGYHKGAEAGLMTLGAVAGIAGAWETAGVFVRNLLGLALATAPRTVPIIVDAVNGYINPGTPGALAISSTTRLSEQEIDTGVRLANQTGKALAESGHIGEEFIDAAKKTYDAMGGGKAFEHFGDGSKFFDSIVSHVNKSVDWVVIDLKGASKEQIAAIKAFVKTLSTTQQQKITYVH